VPTLVFIFQISSPRTEGLNDNFQVKGYGINTYKMEIFDRWGVKVFNSEDITVAWDGSMKGKVAKDNTFVYKVVVTDKNNNKKEYTGHVSLMK